MKYLSLDIGTRRTGVAYADTDVGIPLPLDTIVHQTDDDLVQRVRELASKRDVAHIIVGLPRLPSGDEGSQAQAVRQVASRLEKEGLAITFVDERYTTLHREGKADSRQNSRREYDGDAAAACEILRMHLKC